MKKVEKADYDAILFDEIPNNTQFMKSFERMIKQVH